MSKGNTKREEGVISTGVPCAPLALLGRAGRRRRKGPSETSEHWKRPQNGLRQPSKWPHGGRMGQQPFLGLIGGDGGGISRRGYNCSFVTPPMGEHFHRPLVSNSQHPCWVIKRMKCFNQSLHLRELTQLEPKLRSLDYWGVSGHPVTHALTTWAQSWD